MLTARAPARHASDFRREPPVPEHRADESFLEGGPADDRKELITRALEETRGNRTQAARLLEISHPSLLSKIKAYGIPL